MKDRVVILGAGESGTGAALLAKVKGFDVFVSDQGQIKPQYKEELQSASILFEEGGHTSERILSARLIIKSPGIPEKADIVKSARKAGIEIIDEIEFGFRFLKGRVIAITGTNGKTTTTLLTYHLLRSAGFSVALAGNVGESLARKVARSEADWYVVEISSFQLDGTKTFRPYVAVLLNITPDHLDRYDYKMENYVASKFRITANMQGPDHFIYYKDDSVTSQALEKQAVKATALPVSLSDQSTAVHFDGRAMSFTFGTESFVVRQSDTTLKGPHNLINTMCAVSAARFAGVPLATIREALKTFKNAPHRLEPVGTINGVEFINDSKATNVDSVVYALGSYQGKMLIWIAGGIDKGNDYGLIADQVRDKVKTLICLGKDNSKLHKAFDSIVGNVYETQSVKELVRLALKAAEKGDVVLLSPACASFDLFKNYEDRGNQFREAVQQLKKETENALA